MLINRWKIIEMMVINCEFNPTQIWSVSCYRMPQ